MLRSFFLPLSSRLSSLRCRCSPAAGCSSRSSTESVFLKDARSTAHAGEAPPRSARGSLLTPPPYPPPPAPAAPAAGDDDDDDALPPEPGDGSGDQKSRCTEPGEQKPETPSSYRTTLTSTNIYRTSEIMFMNILHINSDIDDEQQVVWS